MTYRELTAALKVFQLGERATLKEIKSRHRQLVKTHHPDLSSAAESDTIRKINAAYQVLMEYVADVSLLL